MFGYKGHDHLIQYFQVLSHAASIPSPFYTPLEADEEQPLKIDSQRCFTALFEYLVRPRAVHLLFFGSHLISARQPERTPTSVIVRALRKDAAEGEKRACKRVAIHSEKKSSTTRE